jgi:hypothetical protein
VVLYFFMKPAMTRQTRFDRAFIGGLLIGAATSAGVLLFMAGLAIAPVLWRLWQWITR